MRIPVKMRDKLAKVVRREDGNWYAETAPGYFFFRTARHIAYASNQEALLSAIRTIEPCDCPQCLVTKGQS